MNYKKGDLLTPSEYSRLKGVSPARITFLKDKLDKKVIGSRWFVVYNNRNDQLFENPSHLRKERG